MTLYLSAILPCITAALVLSADPPAGSQPKNSEVAQSKAKAPAQPTAEDVLRALQRRRPVNDVIPPGSRAARDAVAANMKTADRLLMPEGSSVVARTGRLGQEGHWWIFTFDDDASLGPTKLLPNANLELMIRTIRGASAPVRFTVTGELTVFEGENYLLPRTALRVSGAADANAKKDSEVSPTPPVRRDASAEDVLSAMRAQQPSEVILPIEGASAEGKGPARSAGSIGSFLSDGSSFMNRVGRLVRQESWWTFVSDSDRSDHPAPPLRMLPNQSLAIMVTESQRGGVIFTVSGEVTLFDGENYLLTRSATRRIDTGNLRR